MRRSAKCIVFVFVSFSWLTPAAQVQRWTVEQANAWYAQQPWLVGSNFIPANAINELEMWQPETFDPNEIDRELGWAEAIGMNTMRVFLHDLLWQQDSQGFLSSPWWKGLIFCAADTAAGYAIVRRIGQSARRYLC